MQENEEASAGDYKAARNRQCINMKKINNKKGIIKEALMLAYGCYHGGASKMTLCELKSRFILVY